LSRLQIANPIERALVTAADAALGVATAPGRWFARPPSGRRARLLVFRFERTGDLIMARPALAALRALAPDAHIELAVGGWNRDIAEWVAQVDRVTVLDLPWLARGRRGSTMADVRATLVRWRRENFDAGINLEGDIRSNLLLWATRIPERYGFAMAGGGPVLTGSVDYDPTAHVAANCVRLVEHAFGAPAGSTPFTAPPLALPADARADADAALRDVASGPLVGVHPCGGRAVKQWDLGAMALAAGQVATRLGATIIVTGGPGEEPLANELCRRLPSGQAVANLAPRLNLAALAGVLARCDVFISPDTGPMHLAAAVGTPTVGIFGPSDPRRWGPLGPHTRVVRVSIWCSPCNRIRNPPARCRGHVPDCLTAVTSDLVVATALDVADEARRHRREHGA